MQVKGQTGTHSQTEAQLCLDLTNTLSWRGRNPPEERLQNPEEVIKWAIQNNIISPKQAQSQEAPEKVEHIYNRLIQLREAIYNILKSASENKKLNQEHLNLLNAELKQAFTQLSLKHGDGGFNLEINDEKQGLESILWKVALSASDLLLSNNVERVKACASEECGWLFIDMSKNRSRRWCSMGDCGNRMKARRHYERKKSLA